VCVCVLKAAADPGLWGDVVMLVADILDVEVLVRLSRNYIPSVTVQIFSFTFLSLSHTQRHTLFLCCAIALQYPGTVISHTSALPQGLYSNEGEIRSFLDSLCGSVCSRHGGIFTNYRFLYLKPQMV